MSNCIVDNINNESVNCKYNNDIEKNIDTCNYKGERRKENGVIFKINELTNPTIDEVLNQVPLIYDPISKKLLLQKSCQQLQPQLKSNLLINNTVTSSFTNRNKDKTSANHNLDTCKCKQLNVNLITNDDKILNDSLIDHYSNTCSLSSNSCSTTSELTNESSSDKDLFEPKKPIEEDLILNSVNNITDEKQKSPTQSASVSLSLSSFTSLNLTASVVNVINRFKKKSTLNEKDLEPRSSTTALILENRPSNLPAKSSDEESRHRVEYEEMVKEAKRKELKDAKIIKKLENKRKKEEEKMIELIKIWNTDLIPNWIKMKNTKKLNDLWWKGIPPSVRGKIWKLAIGNELNLTNELYEICVKRSKEKLWLQQTIENELIVDIIKLDVNRTFVNLGLFQSNGPYHENLIQLLEAYVCYRPDISYVQGMCFLAAMFLLNMECKDAFICLSNLLNSHLMNTFYRVEQNIMKTYYQLFDLFLKENLQDLYSHFQNEKLTPDLYLMDWIYSLFSRSLPLDVSTHVWDLIIRDGDELIIRTSLALLSLYKDILIEFDFIHLAQFLTNLPDDITSDKLLPKISSIKMIVGIEKLNYSQVLSKLLNDL